MSNPWVKFYTSDWRSDPRLRMCSMAARGLWLEMICLMHEATPYGHLLVGGQSPTDAQLAVLVAADAGQVSALIGELESMGVFSRTRAGVIYSRKLTRMEKKAATARNNGRKGGNPNLSKEVKNPTLDKELVKDGDMPQKPETRNQNKKEEPDGSSKKSSSNKNRGSRMTEEWRLPKSWGEWATAEGLPEVIARLEADRFRDYWLGISGQKGVKLDWEATWRNWVRRALDALPKQPTRSAHGFGDLKPEPLYKQIADRRRRKKTERNTSGSPTAPP